MVTRTYRGSARNLAFLASRLRAGELVAAPTETVYGLAANTFDTRACRRIFRAKGRPANDPLIVHVHSLAQLQEICHPNSTALRLAACFWPGPLTLVLRKKEMIPNIVTAGRDSVAVRMPSHPLFRRLLRAAGVPLAAPSANPFGYISPTTAAHVRDGLSGKIGYILDGGATQIGVESTIVDVRDPNRPRLLRPGYVTAEEISRCLGSVARPPPPRWKQIETNWRGQVARATVTTRGPGLLAPGMLTRHYSPRTPVRLHASLAGRIPTSREAFLLLRRPGGRSVVKNVFWLDAKGDLRGVARRLFGMLRTLDTKGYRVIHAERAPGHGLADAINDRLQRAASR